MIWECLYSGLAGARIRVAVEDLNSTGGTASDSNGSGPTTVGPRRVPTIITSFNRTDGHDILGVGFRVPGR